MDWNDLQFFLAVSRTKSLSAAAGQLGTSPSTVSRRIEALEVALNVQLFRHHRNGYVLTPAGQELVVPAEQAELHIHSFESRARNSGGSPAGTVRIDAPELLGQEILLPGLRNFSSRNQSITLEFRTSVMPVGLNIPDNDIILRLVRPERGNYVIRRVGKIGFRCFASRAYVHSEPSLRRDSNLEHHRFIGWTKDLDYLAMARWLQTLFPKAKPGLRLTSLAAQVEAARCGYGIAVLPIFAGNKADLVPVLPENVYLGVDLWMLVHRQVKDVQRVKLTQAAILQLLSESERVLAG